MTSSLLLSLVLSVAPASGGDVYAVVVGHNGGQARTSTSPGLPTLRFADDDALRMARWFEALSVAGGVTVLTTPDAQTTSTLEAAGLSMPAHTAPTRNGLSRALAELKTKLAKRTRPATVFFFYAGHGLTGRLLLEPEAGDEASITGKELKLALMELGALVCTARNPRCGECPLALSCAWVAAGRPAPTGPPKRTQRYEGTDRQARGRLLDVLRGCAGPVEQVRLDAAWPADPGQRSRALDSLLVDGLVEVTDDGLFRLGG